MSRVEEITEKLIQMMTAESEWVKTGIELEEVHSGIRRVAEGAAPHVERLLADERERAEIATKVYWGSDLECGHVRMNLVNYPETGTTVCRACVLEKKAIEAEREKVRGMCAEYLEKEAAKCADSADKEAGEACAAWNREESWYEDSADAIRQLDLTAPSSTEEGK